MPSINASEALGIISPTVSMRPMINAEDISIPTSTNGTINSINPPIRAAPNSTTKLTISTIKVPNPLINNPNADMIDATDVAVKVANVVRPTPNAATPTPAASIATPIKDKAPANANIGTVAGDNNIDAPANTVIPPAIPTKPLIIDVQDIFEKINIGGINKLRATAIAVIPTAPNNVPEASGPIAATANKATAIPLNPLANSTHDIFAILVTGIIRIDKAAAIIVIPAPATSICGPPEILENNAISANIIPIVTKPFVKLDTFISAILPIAPTIT